MILKLWKGNLVVRVQVVASTMSFGSARQFIVPRLPCQPYGGVIIADLPEDG